MFVVVKVTVAVVVAVVSVVIFCPLFVISSPVAVMSQWKIDSRTAC